MIQKVYMLEDGSESPDESKKMCGKVVIDDGILDKKGLPIQAYYVKCIGSELFSPLKNRDIGYYSRNWKMKRVRNHIFELYARFLGVFNSRDKGRDALLRSAERLM
jgi:hypothetical protein